MMAGQTQMTHGTQILVLMHSLMSQLNISMAIMTDTEMMRKDFNPMVAPTLPEPRSKMYLVAVIVMVTVGQMLMMLSTMMQHNTRTKMVMVMEI